MSCYDYDTADNLYKGVEIDFKQQNSLNGQFLQSLRGRYRRFVD